MSDVPFPYDKPLSQRQHEDPGKHYIGETLPAPAADDLSVSGFATGTGNSPNPARSDHTHDNRFRYMRFNSTAKACTAPSAGTKTYINTLNHLAGYDMLGASAQLAVPDRDGLYLITANWLVSRASSSFPALTAYQINIEYNGGAAVRIIEASILPQGRGQYYLNFSDQVALAVDGDIQFAYYNYDTGVTHNVTVVSSVITRLCSSVHA